MAIFANIKDESVIEAEKILIENGVSQEKASDVLLRIGQKLLQADLYWHINLEKKDANKNKMDSR